MLNTGDEMMKPYCQEIHSTQGKINLKGLCYNKMMAIIKVPTKPKRHIRTRNPNSPLGNQGKLHAESDFEWILMKRSCQMDEWGRMSQTEEQPVQNQWHEKIRVLVNYSSVNVKRV